MLRYLSFPAYIRIAAILALVIVAACGYPHHKDPPLYDSFDTSRQALVAANAAILENGGRLFIVADTHSMEPVLVGGDYIVVRAKPFDDVDLGEIVTYMADWQKNGLPVTHRVIVKDRYGLLVGGDNVDGQHNENRTRVTAENYIGNVVAIYRAKKTAGNTL